MLKFSHIIAGVIVSAYIVAPSYSDLAAQDQSLKNLLQCDKIKNTNDRLACFNTIVEKLKQDPPETQRSTSRSNTTRQRVQDFGRSQAQLQRERGGGTSEIASIVRNYWKDGIGRYYFYLANGQIWRETSGSHLQLPRKREGREVNARIKKGFGGGFRIFVTGSAKPGRVTRVD